MTVGSRRTRRTTRRTISQLLSLAVMVVGVLLFPVAVAAQEAPALQEMPSLQILDQATFVEAESTLWFDLTIDLAVVTPGTRPFVSVIVHGALESEDDLDSPLPPVINRTTLFPVSGLDRPSYDRYQVTVPIRGGPQEGDQQRLLLPAAGIYPITIELRTEEGTLATTTTHVVRLDPAAVNKPTGALALVLRVSTGGPLEVEQATQILRSHPEVALTVLFEPGVIDSLRADQTAAAALAEAIAGRPVLASPEPDLNPSALAEIGQADLYREATDLIHVDLAALGFSAAHGVHVIDSGATGSVPTAAGLSVLEELSVGSILDLDGRAATGTIRGDGTAMRLITADRELGALLAGDGGTHRANRLLTALALRVVDGRKDSDPIPAVITPSPLADAEGLTRTVDALLTTLGQPGAPEPVLLAQLTDQRGGKRVRAAERPTQDLRPIADVLASVREKVGTYEGFHPDAPQLRRRIPNALSRGSTPNDRLRMLEDLDATLHDGLAVIELNEGQPVTMAARSAPIPVVIESSADGPRQVMLRLRSDKVSSVDDERLLEIGPGTSSVDVVLVTRSLGVSPLEVSVWTPDGSIQLAVTRFEIRSTAIPGLGLALTAVAVGLLGTWWIVDARKRRRGAIGERGGVNSG